MLLYMALLFHFQPPVDRSVIGKGKKKEVSEPRSTVARALSDPPFPCSYLNKIRFTL